PFLLLAGVLYSVFVAPIWTAVVILALAHLFWTLGLAGQVGLFSSKIDKIGHVLAAYAEAVEMVENNIFSSEMNKKLQASLQLGDTKLSRAFRTLSSLVNSLDARNNMLVGAILNMFFLWDFKYVMKIV